MKKTVSLSIIILALPILAFAHGGADEKFIIRMTDKGFEPQGISIIEGDEVTFINDDDVDRWPASNLHPTHGLYPEFDPQKGLKPGDSWSFVFNKPGVWRMHDHLIPRMTGTITVAEDTETQNSDKENGVADEKGFFNSIKAFFSAIFNKLFGKE